MLCLLKFYLNSFSTAFSSSSSFSSSISRRINIMIKLINKNAHENQIERIPHLSAARLPNPAPTANMNIMLKYSIAFISSIFLIAAQSFRAASHIADAHCACIGVSAQLAECLNLHCRYKRNKGISEYV